MSKWTNRCAAALIVVGLAGCTQSIKLTKDDSNIVLANQTLTAANPAQPGPYKVRMLYYGSGTDKQRRQYRDSVAIKTKTVDGSSLVSLEKAAAEERKNYWGFDTKKFPINGRVWYPEGDGQFPLVLIVHGNHSMKDFSDPGYEYLGQLLASRGFILASVDMNFLNGAIRGENDARGWMLLQHVKAFKAFNDSSSAFKGHVDLHNIALMGHSRGGEAVGHAAAFNRMKYYPDDAKVKFDFNYDIKSIIAIAPVDGQYRPAGQLVPVENVNYLVFHGSHDGDVSTFHGLRQYQRVRFTDGKPWFKAAVFMYRANHGQWNTGWGNKDNGPRSARSLDLRSLVPPEDQREFAKVYVSAFLEATLHGHSEYLPIFRDHRVIGHWLPKTMYITRFQESGMKSVATFEEDVDVSTATAGGVVLQGDSLATWKEAIVPYRATGGDLQNNSAVWLGWSNKVAGDSTKVPKAATYTITLPDTLAGSWHLDREASLSLSLAPTKDTPSPRAAPKDTTKQDSTKKDAKKPAPKPVVAAKPKPAPKDTVPIDLTVELEDANKTVARVPLSKYGAIRRPLEAHILRREDREKQRYSNTFEFVLQTYVIPVSDFLAAAPTLDPSRVRAVRLVFDRSPAGTIILDDIGFSAMRKEFMNVRADGK